MSAGSSGPSGKTESVRLARLLSNRGSGSRSEADKLIRNGRVTVDGAVVRNAAAKFPETAELRVDGELVSKAPLLMAYHKPKGIITTMDDDWGRDDLRSGLPPPILKQLHPVGRLDGDTSGLLLLARDGQLTHRLLQPRYGVEREYVATVEVPPGTPPPGPELVGALAAGVQTSEGTFAAKVLWCKGDNVCLVVTEGKYRMVRRILANCGYPVLELKRVRYGEVYLGDLPPGHYSPVTGPGLAWAEQLLKEGLSQAEAGADLNGRSF